MTGKKYRISNSILWPLLFFMLLAGYMIVTNKDQRDKWSNKTLEKRYTLGVITEFKYRGRGGPSSFKYEFSVNNEIFTNEYPILSELQQQPSDELRSYIGKCFYVKFILEEPKYNKLLFDIPVSDNISDIPKMGWKTIMVDSYNGCKK